MAIYVEIKDAAIVNNQLALAITTTNSALPGQSRRFDGTYDATKTVMEIKAEVDNAVQLLWVALSNPSWTI